MIQKIKNGIFLRSSLNSSSNGIYNFETHLFEESSDVVFDEVKTTKEIEIDYDEEKDEVIMKAHLIHNNEAKKELEFHKDHHKELAIGPLL